MSRLTLLGAVTASALIAFSSMAAAGDHHKKKRHHPNASSDIYNAQVLEHNVLAIFGEYNDAAIGGGAFSGATGVIGANVLSGDVNLQANEASISSVNTPQARVDAEIFNLQLTHKMVFINPHPKNNNDATINGSAFSGSGGIVGANVAAGHLNEQKNAVTIAHASDAKMASASVAALQTIREMGVGVGPRSNHARIGGTAFSNADGVVNANVVSGAANQQLNAVSIAAVN